MRIGLVLADGTWAQITAAARRADAAGIDAVGFWDHYHSPSLAFAPHNGWAVYGYLAAITRHLRLCPLVLDAPNYSIGRLAKESAMLAILSGGRFELGIGIGDIPDEEAAWGQPPMQDTRTRVAWLTETIAALRLAWRGTFVDFAGDHVHLKGARCAPPPPAPPRVVVGAGGSPRLVRAATHYADEINVYGDPALIAQARATIAACGRPVTLSACADEFEHFGDHIPGTLADQLAPWREQGIDRLFISLYAPYDYLLPSLCEMSPEVEVLAPRAG